MDIQWPLALFTFLACSGAGTLAFASAAVLTGEKNIKVPSIVGAACVFVGMATSFFHLAHPLNVLNAMEHLYTSLGREMMFLLLAGVCAIVLWLFLQRNERAAKVLACVEVLLCVVASFQLGLSYVIRSIPAWDTYLVPALYLLSALFAGGALFCVLTNGFSERAKMLSSSLTIAFAILWVALLVAYALHCSANGVALDAVSILFWGGVAGTAVLALVCLVLGSRASSGQRALRLFVAAAVLALVSSLLFRVVFFLIGSHIPYCL